MPSNGVPSRKDWPTRECCPGQRRALRVQTDLHPPFRLVTSATLCVP